MTTAEAREREVHEPERAMQLVAEACHRPAVDVWARLDERMEASVLAAIREALESHRSVVADAGLRDEAPEASEALLDGLRTYRHGMADQVLPALELVLEHQQPTLLAAHEIGSALEAAREASRGLPFRSQVRWGSGALEPIPTDGPGRRVRKVLARVLSAARKPDESRDAPLRGIALHHLSARVGPALDASMSEAVRARAAWVGRLERACADWAAEALPVFAAMTVGVGAGRGEALSDPRDAPEEEDSGSSDVIGDGSWARVATAAHGLGEALGTLLDEVPHEAAREALEGRLGTASMELGSDLRAAGSFVYRPPDASADAPLPASGERVRRGFDAWDTRAAARLALYRSFLELLLGANAVIERLEERSRTTVLEPHTALARCRREIEALATVARRRIAAEPTHGTLDELRAEAETVLARAIDDLPDPAALPDELEALVSDAVDALQSIVRQSPDLLVLHPLHDGAPDAIRPDETRSVPFQDLARQSFDAMRIERIRAAVLELGAALGPIRASVVELPDVLTFAFDAARSELSGDGAGDEQDGGPEERAARFAVEALERSAGVVRDVPERVEVVLERARDRVRGEVARGAEALLERLGAGRMQSQLLRARSNVSELWLRLTDRVGPGLKRLRRFARFRYLRTRRASRRLLRAARGLVGDGAPVSDVRAARTIRAFATADAGAGHVPLVYQRLFSMDPVEDPGFLVGRAAELADVLKRWRRWLDEDEVPLVIRGYPGVGVTSFLNGCASMLEERGATVVRVQVPARMLEEEALAALLADALGVRADATLAGLAGRVLELPRESSADVVLLDGLEHLYLRVPRGTDLLERLLTLMSETEPHTFWLAGVGQPAWQLLGRAEPTAVSQVDGLPLLPLTVERLRETILQRHRRSGLRLRFLEPRAGRALLRRRARRLRGTEGHQRLLGEDFFEQLHRVSLGNLKLAMFHWLLAADFESSEGEVLVHPLVRPDFTVLEDLDDTQNFALKALLEHRTLTLEEHCRIFRTGRQESYQVFESLQNRRLVEELTAGRGRTSDGSELERASRYRIRPLLVGAVTAHLRTRNIMH